MTNVISLPFAHQTICNILAFAAPPTAPGQPANPVRDMLMSIGPFIFIFAIFYLILIRPQQKQQKELRKMLDALKTGDKVVTTAGIFGIISQVKDKSVVVKIADNTKVEMLRTAIQQVVPAEDKKDSAS
jgi:preprotein translocase subunit YajC